MGFEFVDAVKTQAKVRLGLAGPAGSGKTYSALSVATALGGRIALIDSERGSARKYGSGKPFTFKVLELSEHSIDTYIGAIEAAGRAGFDVLIIDSASHEWMGKGGALEEVDKAGEGSSKFTKGWGRVTPKHTRFIDAVLAYPGHVIVTLRSKMEYVLEERNGKQVPTKVGMAPVQREGFEYELDVFGQLNTSSILTITKSRCPELTDKIIDKPGKQIAEALLAWLSDGAPAVEPAPPPPSEPHPLEAKIASVGTLADLDNLTAELKRLPEKDRDYLRPIFQARKAELAA